MTPAVKAVLPWPPSVNTYWRHPGGRSLVSRRGREYRSRVMGCALEQSLKRGLRGDLKMEIQLYPVDRRNARMDVDNACKGILDSLQAAGVYEDDRQINDLRVKRIIDNDHQVSTAIVYIWERQP